MEDLNKQQIILLCILISFVVSIATGIITTSLLMQAPVTLSQTVQDVIERTVQTVTPAPTVDNPNPTPTSVQTVVVSEDDSVTGAVVKTEPSLVRIHATSADGTIDNLYGLGIVVNSSAGIIASDAQYISPVMTYTALLDDGTVVPLVAVTGNKGDLVQFFKMKLLSSTTPPVAVHLATSDLKLGQTVISIGGAQDDAVTVGRVVSLEKKTPEAIGTSTPPAYVAEVNTDISPVDQVAGAPVLDLSGNVVGISLSAFSSSKTYLPAAIIADELSQIQIVP